MSTFPNPVCLYKKYTKANAEENVIPAGKTEGNIIEGSFIVEEFKILKDVEWEWREEFTGTVVMLTMTVDTGVIQYQPKYGTKLSDYVESVVAEWDRDHGDSFYSMFAAAKEDVITMYVVVLDKVEDHDDKGVKNFERIIVTDIKVGEYWLKPMHVSGVADEIRLGSSAVIIRTSPFHLTKHMEGLVAVNNVPNSKKGDVNKKMKGVVGTPTSGLLSREGERIFAGLRFSDFEPKEEKKD